MSETGQPIAKAYIANSYKIRLGIIALACLGFAGWFFYDGAVKYPWQKELYEERQRLASSGDPEWSQQWTRYAQEQGWSPEVEPVKRTDMDITTQYLMGLLVLPVGLLFGYSFVRAQGRWVAADDTGLRTSSRQHAPWSSIKAVDKSRWKSKGIAVVRYTDAGGGEQKITLDDWKFDRDPTVAMVEELDRRLGLSETSEPAEQAVPASPPSDTAS